MSGAPTIPRPPSRLRRDVALVAAGALVLSLAAEGVARLAWDQPQPAYVAHPFFRVVRTPHWHQKKWSLETPTYQFDFETNLLGFRGKNMTTVKKPAGTYRIFFVGASTTENMFLPEEKTFPGVVESALGAATHGAPRVEVGNCGVSGFGIARSLSLIEHGLLPLEPDLIVVLDGANDLLMGVDSVDPARTFVERPEPTTFKDFLLERSRLLAVLDAKLSRKEADPARFFGRRKALARSRPYYVPPDLDVLRGVPAFEQRLRWVALICHDAGVPLAFLTQPTLWKAQNAPAEMDAMVGTIWTGPTHLDPATCFRIMSAYNDAIRRVAREQKTILIDLAAEVPSNLEDFCDDVHMTAAGNALAGKIIARELLHHGKLPAAR